MICGARFISRPSSADFPLQVQDRYCISMLLPPSEIRRHWGRGRGTDVIAFPSIVMRGLFLTFP